MHKFPPIPSKPFNGFKYRIDKLKEGESAILKFPDLMAYGDVFASPEITMDHEVVIRYLILMYTPGSPAISLHNHIGKRKVYALSLLGVQHDENGVYPEYNDLLLLRGDGIRKAFVTFLMIQHSIDWAYMMHAIEELEMLMKMHATVDGDMGTKRRKQMQECRNQIEEAVDRLASAERSRVVFDAIEWFRAQRSLKIRPEERIYEMTPLDIPEKARAGECN